MKYLFRNDYSFGAHPKVMDAVCAVNLEGNWGYGRRAHRPGQGADPSGVRPA